MNTNERQKYINIKQLIFFNTISTIFPSVLFGFTPAIKNFKNSSWIILIMITLALILILMFFKGFNNNFNSIKYLTNNIFLKILVSVYLIIVISILNISACLIIKKFFYTNNSILFLGIINIIIALILSKSSIKKIISTSIIFFIFLLLFYLLPLFSNKNRDFSFLFPFNVNIKNIPKLLICLIFPLESILIILFNNQTKTGIKTKHIITSSILSLISLIIITVDSITLLSPNFLNTLKYSSFYRWNFLSTNSIIQNYDILIFIIVITTILFRLSYYFKILKISLTIKQNHFTNLIILIIFSLVLLLLNSQINSLAKIINISSYFMFFIIFVIFAFFALKSMEAQNEQK